MARSGLRRTVDELGRVVIPSGIRKQLGIRAGDELDVRLDGTSVVLERAVDLCTFCGADAELRRFRGRAVCRTCTAALRAIDVE